MALPESAFREPYWIRIKYEATLSRDDRLRFADMDVQYDSLPTRHWRIKPQSGHNAQNPSITADRVALSVDAPYIRAR